MDKKKAVQPLSENTRKAIIIAAIVAVAIIILSVSLALILRPDTLSPSDQTRPGSGTSTLPIRNGDFAYVSSDDTLYPKTAQNWTKYGYKAKSGSSHDFESISTNEKVLMGIVDTANTSDNNEWDTVISDLANEGITDVKNPGVHETIEAEDTTIYMIATKEATTASILSDSTSISSGKSVKITIWLNTQQLKDGSSAVVMVQKSTVSAKKDYWYAYSFAVNKDSAEYETDANGWQKLEFYIFNRESSTQYIRVNIGIGNVYSGEEGLDLVGEQNDEPIKGEGILFVDDITLEEVTANDYREVVDGVDTIANSYKILENEDITDESTYLELEGKYDGLYTSSEQFAEESTYSPFTDRDDYFKKEVGEDDEEILTPTGFKIYKLHHDGSKLDGNISLRLSAPMSIVSSLTQKDHLHFSFWIRVTQVNKLAIANVYVQSRENETDEWEDLTNGSWTAQVTSQEVDTDSNCGWVKYDIYLKPSANLKYISIYFLFGNDSYSDKDEKLGLYPDGDMYVTSPAYEKISYKDYNSASSGSYVKKIDLIGAESTANATVANGSFSSLNNTGTQPASWTPSFAGDNTLYRDGLGNEEIANLTRLVTDVDGSGVVSGYTEGSGWDDDQRNVLLIKNNVATSFGYFSNDITLSARTAYVFSVLAKTGNNNPYIYLLNTDTSLSRSERVIESITSKYESPIDAETERLLGQDVVSQDLNNGWTRYYIVVVTGNESQTVRLALFNGSLEGDKFATGEVYYDAVEILSLGTYSLDDDDTLEEDEVATHYVVNWSGNYEKTFEELMDEELLAGIKVVQPSEEEWEEITLIPEEEENGDGEEGSDTLPKEDKDVDLGLLFSVISSVALVAALLVVVVVRYFKGKGKVKKAA